MSPTRTELREEVAQLTAERDRARDIAVGLEQELARLRSEHEECPDPEFVHDGCDYVQEAYLLADDAHVGHAGSIRWCDQPGCAALRDAGVLV